MKYLTYLFIIFQFTLGYKVLGENIKKIYRNSPEWKVIEKNKLLKKSNLKWKILSGEEILEEILIDSEKNNFDNYPQKSNITNWYKFKNEIIEIQPIISLNNYLNDGEFNLSTNWKSSFSGGAGGGTGNQNISLKFHYGIDDDSLISIYLSETDDPLYNLIDGKLIENNWFTAAISYRKQIFESDNQINNLSFAGSLEYWVISSGSENSKSIYNNIDNTLGLDRHEKFIYSFSLPFTKKVNKKTKFSLVPGATFLPDKLGKKNNGKNFYGNNLFLASGLNFEILRNFQLLSSYTYLFGPGNNYFDENLNFKRKPIYSFGFNWEVNPIIGIEAKITNGYGSTPSTSLLTIPSDNTPLYYLSGSYKPFGKDTEYNHLSENDEFLLFGGLTVNNALIPSRGTSQLRFDYDNKGNVLTFYGYSLSNIFQLELSTGFFKDVKLAENNNEALRDKFLNDLNYRFGGKLSIFSPQKGDLFWTSLRTSVGRNEGTAKQGYNFTELINTFKINESIHLNITPKYFFSGTKSFGGLGISTELKLLKNIKLIPEINTSLKKDPDFNSSIVLRYIYQPQKSVDFYYSNAAGINDIGQLLEAEDHRFGIKFNLLY